MSAPDPAFRRLLGIAAILFISYLAVAMPLPALPVYVLRHFGMSNVFGGLAVGIAFLSTILTRAHAGGFSDKRGAKLSVERGLWVYALAALVCLASVFPGLPHGVSYAVLIVGRLLLGLGESLVVVGVIGWGVGHVGPLRSGRVLAFVGMAMYGALAVGGPIGLMLLRHAGFAGLMIACALLPLLGLALCTLLPGVAPHPGQREPFSHVIGKIWQFGVVVCLQGVGYAGLAAFISLDFIAHHWQGAAFGLTFFGAGFVLVRILFGHLPDRLGGTPVAIVSLIVEACGQFLLWLAPGPLPAMAGAFLTGLGCSMVFPSMGLEAMKRVPPQLRGTAVGGFAAFQDIAYAGTGPVAGVFADHAGYASIFLVGGISAVLGLGMAVLAHRQARA